MKKQYRYKTAADNKLFFSEDAGSIQEIIYDLVRKLNDVIDKTFKNGLKGWISDQFTKLKKLGAKYSRESIKHYFDYFIFPNDVGAQVVSLIKEYQNFLTNVYNYTNQDDYKNTDETIKYCEKLQNTFNGEWKIESDEKGDKTKIIFDTLNKIANAAKAIADAEDGKAKVNADAGFDGSNVDKINILMNTTLSEKEYPISKEKMGPISEVVKVLNEITTTINNILDSFKNNEYYMLKQSESSNPGDNTIGGWIAKRIKDINDHKAEEEKDKEHARKMKEKKQQEEEEKADKPKVEEGKSSGGANRDKKDESKLGSDEVIKIINKHITGNYDAAYELIKGYVIKMFDSDRDKLKEQGYKKEAWTQLVNASFIKFDEALKKRLNEDNINDRYSKNNLQSYIKNNVTMLSKKFNDAFKTLLELQRSNLISKNSPNIEILQIKSIKDIWSKFVKNTLATIDAELKGKV